MCGIFGCLCDDAPRVLIEGLKRLEYRGYDSVGIALIGSGGIKVIKEKGRIDDFAAGLSNSALAGKVGLGHTRWATHGAPCRENAHPHTDCSGRIAVVHNGVIENFMELKEGLVKRGHVFSSRTDTEVIPHLLEEGIRQGLGLKEAAVSASRRIKGSMAVAAISASEPDRIVCIRRESPLIIGIGYNGVYCSSDIPALLPYTNEVIVVPEETVVVMRRDGISMETLGGSPLEPKPTKIDWDMGMAMKGGYPHFMMKEISEQPLVLSNTLKIQRAFLERAVELIGGKAYLTGSGTSYHACLTASYLFSKIAKADIRAVHSSEFQDAVADLNGSTVIGVSQSGETADTLSALKYAKMMGARIVGITNTLGSSITTSSDIYICTQSGPEIGVAATKTFLTQLAALDQLVFAHALARGAISKEEYAGATAQLERLPAAVQSVVDRIGDLKGVAMKYSRRKDAYFLARGINVATALEGALKLKEISYIHAEGYPAGESKHGPISLVEEGFLCVFVAPSDSARGRVIGNMMEMKARGAEIFSIITKGDRELIAISDEHFEVPEVPEYAYPIVCTIPLQAFAYFVAVARGYDPDRPRNLAKSVTVL